MRTRNPIVILALIGLAIIAGVAAYTFLRPEPQPALMSATYGYYHMNTSAGQVEIQGTAHESYTFEGRFALSTTAGTVETRFDGRAEGLRNAAPGYSRIGGTHGDSRLPLPTAIDAGIFTGVAQQMTFLLLPERWDAIH